MVIAIFGWWTNLTWRYRILLGLAILFGIAAIGARIDAGRGIDTPPTAKLIKGTGKHRELVVVVHGWTGNINSMQGVQQAIEQKRPDADLLMIEYPAQLFSNADPFRLASQFEEEINKRYEEHKYDRITLMGYSIGALLVRKAYVYGSGTVEDAPFSDAHGQTSREVHEWVRHVDRIVLLAGTNRGFSLAERPKDMSLQRSAVFSGGYSFMRWTGTGLLIRQFERGEPFVANLRLQWLNVMEQAKKGQKGLKRPVVIQLLGDKDDVVSEADSRDVTVARDFVWVGLNNTGHANVVTLDESGSGQERKRKLMLALGSDEEVQKLKESTPTPDTQVDLNVTTVVFVLHGIRDMGDWTSQFEDQLQKAFDLKKQREGKENDKLHIHSASYGYFSMGAFLLLEDRQRNVRWFMDQVTEVKARFPNLKEIHFIGHSNGTYLLASALEKYRTLQVNRVVFAGSVVRRDYPWNSYGGRVGDVRNYVGSADAVVSLLPCVFEQWPLSYVNRDLGSAGYNGFEDAKVRALEMRFVRGGHGAALDKDNVSSIVDFIMEGKKIDIESLTEPKHPGLLDTASHFCLVLWLTAVALVVLIGLRLPYWVGWLWSKYSTGTGTLKPVLIWSSRLAYIGLVWLFLSRF